jgi:hypothetical protein
LSGEKRDTISLQNQRQVALDPFPESKEINAELANVTNIVNQKQQLIVGITQKLGEFVSGFRSIRKGVDDLKAGLPDQTLISSIEKYLK